MVCHVFCKPSNQSVSVTPFPVRKFVFILMLLMLLPLLTASGVQLLTSRDSDGMLVNCKGSQSHVNATCPAVRAFMASVTTLVDGKVIEATSLTNAFLEPCAASPQDFLPFSADLSPLTLLTTPPSPTRETATLSDLSATADDHRGGLATSTLSTSLSHVSFNHNSVSRASYVPVRTYDQAAALPPETSSFGVRESCMITLVFYTTAMLGVFCYYINKLEAQRAVPETRKAAPEADYEGRPHRRHSRYSRARYSRAQVKKDQAVSDAMVRDLNRISDGHGCVHRDGLRNGGPRHDLPMMARIAALDYTRNAHGLRHRADRGMFNYRNGVAGIDNNMPYWVNEMRYLENRHRRLHMLRPPVPGNLHHDFQCPVHDAGHPPPVPQPQQEP